MLMKTIATHRLRLRPFMLSDAQAAALNSQQPEVAHFMSDMILRDEAAAAGWIQWLNGVCQSSPPTAPAQVLAVERKEDQTCIGLVGFGPKKELGGEVEVLYAIADPYSRQGYATEALRALVSDAFERTELDRLVAIIKPANRGSRVVAERVGFVYLENRTLPYDGVMTEFEYFRLHRRDFADAR